MLLTTYSRPRQGLNHRWSLNFITERQRAEATNVSKNNNVIKCNKIQG